MLKPESEKRLPYNNRAIKPLVGRKLSSLGRVDVFHDIRHRFTVVEDAVGPVNAKLLKRFKKFLVLLI